MKLDIAIGLIELATELAHIDRERRASGQTGIIDPTADNDPISEVSDLLICRGACPNAVNCLEAVITEIAGRFPQDFQRIFDAAEEISGQIAGEA